MIIQQVYLPEAKYSIFIKGIKPDEDDPSSGEIIINGNPTRLERHERYHIDNEIGILVTDSYNIPMPYVIKFLQENGCLVKNGDKTYVAFKEVIFKPNF